MTDSVKKLQIWSTDFSAWTHPIFCSSSSSFSFLDHVPTSVEPVTLSVKSFKSVQSFLSNYKICVVFRNFWNWIFHLSSRTMKKYDHANAAPYTVDLLSRRGYEGVPLSAAICKESRSRDFCDITLHVKYLEFTATHFFCFSISTQ